MHTIAWHENVCSRRQRSRRPASLAADRHDPRSFHRRRADARRAASPAPRPSRRSTSPGGTLTVSVTLDADGRPGYAVARGGQPVIAESRLGFILADAPKLERGFRLDGVGNGAATTKPGSSPGASGATCATATTSCACASSRSAPAARRLDLVFRAFDDGVGFRYEFPGAAGARATSASSRSSRSSRSRSPRPPGGYPAGDWNRYEYLYQQTPLAEVGQAHTPITVRTAERPAPRLPRGGARRLLRRCGCGGAARASA